MLKAPHRPLVAHLVKMIISEFYSCHFFFIDQVVALFPYTAQNEDELTFLQGDVVVVIDREDPAWWRGQLKGQVNLKHSFIRDVSSAICNLIIVHRRDFSLPTTWRSWVVWPLQRPLAPQPVRLDHLSVSDLPIYAEIRITFRHFSTFIPRELSSMPRLFIFFALLSSIILRKALPIFTLVHRQPIWLTVDFAFPLTKHTFFSFLKIVVVWVFKVECVCPLCRKMKGRRVQTSTSRGPSLTHTHTHHAVPRVQKGKIYLPKQPTRKTSLFSVTTSAFLDLAL